MDTNQHDAAATQDAATPPQGHGSPAPEPPRALWWDDAEGALCLLDQSRLPAREDVLVCRSAREVAEAIRALRVRGAPAIGVAAAYGLALGMRDALDGLPPGDGARLDAQAARTRLDQVAQDLCATRPTAVNLSWAVTRAVRAAEQALQRDEDAVATLPTLLLDAAHRIAAEDAAACRAMGRYGATLIRDGDTLLTHCNAGALATAGLGTALAPIYVAHQAGRRLHVYVDETRPVLQGARLTAWELSRAGIPITLITDNMAGHFLRRGGIRAIFVGADRIAANGDVANKIGTYTLAVLAREHGVPFYVVAPRSTVDLGLASGDLIPIEERAPAEVTQIAGVRIAPEGVRVANPAFDITPARYISGIITEVGILSPPFDRALAEAMHRDCATPAAADAVEHPERV